MASIEIYKATRKGKKLELYTPKGKLTAYVRGRRQKPKGILEKLMED